MSDEVIKRKVGAPPIALFDDPSCEPLVVRLINAYVDTFYDKQGKFSFSLNNKVRVGQASGWGILYVILMEHGMIKDAQNVNHYHEFLQEHITQLDTIVPRNKISNEISKYRKLYNAIYLDDEEVKLTHCLKRKLPLYKEILDKIEQFYQDFEKQKRSTN